MPYWLSLCISRRTCRQNRLYETLLHTVIILSKHHHHIRKTVQMLYELKEISAINIQRVFRGVLVRLSDRYMLMNLYRSLPSVWRTILHSNPNESDLSSSAAEINHIVGGQTLMSDVQELKGEVYTCIYVNMYV
jgi:hypothetical protein